MKYIQKSTSKLKIKLDFACIIKNWTIEIKIRKKLKNWERDYWQSVFFLRCGWPRRESLRCHFLLDLNQGFGKRMKVLLLLLLIVHQWKLSYVISNPYFCYHLNLITSSSIYNSLVIIIIKNIFMVIIKCFYVVLLIFLIRCLIHHWIINKGDILKMV